LTLCAFGRVAHVYPVPSLADVAKGSIAVENPCVSWEFEDLSSVAFGLLT